MSYIINPKKRFEKLEETSFLINDFEVGKWMFDTHISELPLIEWCRDNFKNGQGNFVDIGAHIGTWSWLLAPFFNHVYSFEPNKHVYNHMCGNIAIKNLSSKIDTYNVGLSEKEDVLQYYERSNDGGGNGFTKIESMNTMKSYELPVKRLDDFTIRNISFIKIDVEGHEIDVLKGAQQTLVENDYPTCIIECWENNKTNLSKYLETIGYKMIGINVKDMYIASKIRN
jgi:FkbM family methyltransferase